MQMQSGLFVWALISFHAFIENTKYALKEDWGLVRKPSSA